MGGWQNGGWDVFSFTANPVNGPVYPWGPTDFHVESTANPVTGSNPHGPAKGDVRWVTDAAITAALKNFTSATIALTQADVGKTLNIAGAGPSGGALFTTIASVQSATAATTAAAATGTVSGANACLSTDDSASIQSAINAALTAGAGARVLFSGKPYGANLLVPAPGVMDGFTDAPTGAVLILQGDGMYATRLVQIQPGAGILQYGVGGNNPKLAQTFAFDLTLDGNYSGVSGGVFPQQVAGVSGLWASLSPWTNIAGLGPHAGAYNIAERVRFYRSSGFTSFPSNSLMQRDCVFDSTGQPDVASGGLHYDNIGSGSYTDCICLASSWVNASGNYADFVGGAGAAQSRLTFIANVSTNHQIGGIYAAGDRSVVALNRLHNNVAGSGVGYDSTSSAVGRQKNLVMGNVLENILVNGSGLSFATYGDEVGWNIAQDSTLLDAFAPILAEQGISLGSTIPARTGAVRIASDGTALYLEAGAGGGGGAFYLRPTVASNANQFSGTGAGIWQTYDGGGAIRNIIDDGNGGIVAKANIRRGRATPGEAALVSGVDAATASLMGFTLTAARLVGAPLNPAIGQRLTFTFIQGGAGAFAVTWNAIFKKTWSDAGNATGARSTISFVYDGTNWNQDGAQAPYV